MPPAPRQSRSRLWKPFGPLSLMSIGLSLLAVVFSVVNVRNHGIEVPEPSVSEATGAAADFAASNCPDLDITEVTEFTGGVEPVDARGAGYAEGDPDAPVTGSVGTLHCEFESGSGLSFGISVLADTADDTAASLVEQNRAVWGGLPGYRVEDFRAGSLVGFTKSQETASLQELMLYAGSGRIVLILTLIGGPGSFEDADAVVPLEAVALSAAERFTAYG